MPRVIDIYNYIDSFAPFSSQEEWDNSGFLVGESDKEVNKILVCLDITSATLNQAENIGCELIVSHHPVFMGGLKSLTDNCLAYKCAKKGIAVISAHTCYDFAEGGVSDICAQALGLKNIRKAKSVPFTLGETDCKTVMELAEKAKDVFDTDITYSLEDKPIKTVAVVAGSGIDFMYDAMDEGADVFFTGEDRHHAFINAAENGLPLVCAGHFETEIIAVRPLAERLEKEFPEVKFYIANEASPMKHI